MSNLNHRQQKIQEKRKQTPWRDFVMSFASWFPLVLQKDKGNISRYPSELRWKNIHYNYDIDSSLFGLDYSSDFFFDVQKLFEQAPKLGNLNFPNLENCQFSESVFGGKSCYLSIDVGEGVENILYSSMVLVNCKNIISSVNVNNNSENIYYCKNITSSFNCFYSKYLHSSQNIWFSTNLIGCQECLFCDNLINQSYYIENKQYEKESYYIKKQEILNNKASFEDYYNKLQAKPFIRSSEEVTGGGLVACSNIENGYFLTRFSEGRNIMLGEGGNLSKNCFDCFYIGTNATDYYAMVSSGIESSNCYCSVWITRSHSIYYSYYLINCSFCLGCIGLKNKSYCIFNKQYTKEERYTKVDEIFSQMDRDGTLGQFFPPTMNPFYFNDTAAYLIDNSFTKEEVTAKGYLWRDEPIKVDIPDGMKIINIDELENYEGWMTDGIFAPLSAIRNPQSHNSLWYIDPEILKVIIQDEQGNIYKIVKMEYDFLMKHGLPLPRKHRLDRMKENFRIN